MLRFVQTRIVQSSSRDALSEISLAAEQSRAAFRTKTAHVVAHHFAGCAEVFRRALGNLERLRRYVENRGVRAARCLLAITAMAVEHHDRFGTDFVANRAARAAAGKCCMHDRIKTPGLSTINSQLSTSTSAATACNISRRPRTVEQCPSNYL